MVTPNKASKYVIDHQIILDSDFFELQAFLNERDTTHGGKDDVMARYYRFGKFVLDKEMEVGQMNGAKFVYKLTKIP